MLPLISFHFKAIIQPFLLAFEQRRFFQNIIIIGLHLRLDRSNILPISCYVWWCFNHNWQPVIYSLEIQKDMHSIRAARDHNHYQMTTHKLFPFNIENNTKIFVWIIMGNFSFVKSRVNRFKAVSFSINIIWSMKPIPIATWTSETRKTEQFKWKCKLNEIILC